MDKIEIILAEVLDELRVSKGQSYQDIASYIGMSRFTVRDYMKGKTRLYWSTVVGICHALGIEYEEVIKKVEERMKK